MIWSRLAKTGGLLSSRRGAGTNVLLDREGNLTEEVWPDTVQVAEWRTKRNKLGKCVAAGTFLKTRYSEI
jgi:hypothetical protein